MYTLSIQFNTLEELQAHLGTPSQKVAAEPKVKVEIVEEKVTAKNEPAPKQEEVNVDVNLDVVLDYVKDIQTPAVRLLTRPGGRPLLEKILAGFNVKVAKELDESLWPALVEAINAALKETE